MSARQRRVAMAARESEALAQEYREHSAWLAEFARRRVGPVDAADLVHEAFLRAARYPSERRDRPRHLLVRILANLLRDRARGAARERVALGALETEPGRASETLADQHDMLVLKEVVLGMPGPMRDVFLLSRFTPLTQAEIAGRLGISVKTVEWRLGRALAYCAERLAG